MTADPRPRIKHPFIAADGIPLEVDVFPARRPRRAVVILWPCTTADALGPLYQVPREAFAAAGVDLVLYNPRGHGNSRGVYSSSQALDDLEMFLNERVDMRGGIPLIGVGHSGASFSFPALADRLPFTKFIFVSPILNARESGVYMLDHGNAGLWIRLFDSSDERGATVARIIRERHWIDTRYWKEQKLCAQLDFPLVGKGVYFESVGRFLENLFHTDLDSTAGLTRQRAITTIFLPQRDVWYPDDKTEAFARGIGIPVERPPAAKEHFFMGAWSVVWQQLLRIDKGRVSA